MDLLDALRLGWPGQQYRFDGTGHPVSDEESWADRLEWLENNSMPKPTLAEVEARRTEYEAGASGQ